MKLRFMVLSDGHWLSGHAAVGASEEVVRAQLEAAHDVVRVWWEK